MASTRTIFEERIQKRTQKSRAVYEEARLVLPGGVAANTKAISPYPLYIRGARGSRVTDIDGNEYIDLVMGLGIHILGHAPAAVVEAVRERLASGPLPGMATELEVELARKVRRHMACAEMVRFVNSGTEATLMAIRVARAYRRRDKIAKFEGNYDGQHDLVQVSTNTIAGPVDAPEPSLNHIGVAQSTLRDLVILPYNDPERATALIRTHADELAGVIMEPVAGFGMGCVPATREFLHAIREVTAKHDIPLILDEVVTNFRLGLGGASEYYGVRPDLVTLGKIVGGGFPIGGYAGRRDLMDRFVTLTGRPSDEQEKISQSGTFSGNAVSMAAGLAAITALEDGAVYRHLDLVTERLLGGLKKLAAGHDFTLAITGLGSMFQLHFGLERLTNIRERSGENRAQAAEFSHGLLASGVFAVPRPWFMSAAHTPEDVDTVLAAAGSVLDEMKRAKPAGVAGGQA
jgi:glutamate-1-semialdehyde 2,1-aminomutase